MFWPRMSSSPAPDDSSMSARSSSTTGADNPTVSGRFMQYSWGRKVETDDVSVSPKPLPSRALGKLSAILATVAGGGGAPPYVTSSTWDTSKSAKLGWLMASQMIAGTDVMRLMRSSTTARRNACTSKAVMMTTVPPRELVTSNWLLQPVTWNIGTEMRFRSEVPPCRFMTRRHVSALERKFSWVVMAPLGNPVVPLV